MINGIINVYKERGFTSHDVVAKLRGITRQKKIGHTGTLDPEAVGVLPVCLGSATKLCDMLTEKRKEYIAEVQLGIVTDTQDTTGTILEECAVTVSEEEVTSVINGFIGDCDQIPPMYSAIKVNGKKLYELARAGKEVEREPRKIHLYEIEIMEMQLPKVKIRVLCSKGTYIRTLCHDIGQVLGCGAAMAALERTRSGKFTLETAHTLAEIESLRDAERLSEIVIPIEKMFAEYPKLSVLPEFERLIENGNAFLEQHLPEEEQGKPRGTGQQYRIYIRDGVFVGIYEYRKQEHRFCPVKMFISG